MLGPSWLLLLVAATVSCGSPDVCKSGGAEPVDGGPVIRGRVTTQRYVMGEFLHLIDEGLDGATIQVRNGGTLGTRSNAQGCFALPVEGPGGYLVEATLPGGVFLAARSASVTAYQGGGFGQWPPSIDIALAPSSLVGVSVVPASDDEVRIDLRRLVDGEAQYMERRLITGAQKVWFADFGPGRYVLMAELNDDLRVYYPDGVDLEDALVLNVGLHPIELPDWFLP